MSVERYRVIICLEYPVPDHESPPRPEMNRILHSLHMHVLHCDILESTYLDGEVVRRKVQKGKPIDIQVLDIEESHLAGQSDDAGDIQLPARAAVQAVALKVKSSDAYPFIIFPGERTPVDKGEPGSGAVRTEFLAEHYHFLEGQVRSGIQHKSPADWIYSGLPDTDPASSVKALLKSLGISQGVISGQEAIAVGIFHRRAGHHSDQHKQYETDCAHHFVSVRSL